MRFSLMFFPTCTEYVYENKYELLTEVVKYADKQGFDSIWTPERHFTPFGAIFPNPAITSAAIAMITKQINIRAGSLVSPLHNTIRIAEDWSMVDNLSNGRIGIAFGSGWNVNDFIFYPERYKSRKTLMYEQIREIQCLWKGEPFIRENGHGETTELFIYPVPIQKQLPVWITTAGTKTTFYNAASIGANIFTHMVGQDITRLSERISLYREQLRQSGFNPSEQTVTVMLHTFIDSDQDYVLLKTQEPLRKYLQDSFEPYLKSSQVIHDQKALFIENQNSCNEMLNIKLKNCLNTSLIGTPEKCKNFIESLKEIGVDEVACLLDFGLKIEDIMKSLAYLNDLRNHFSGERRE